MTQSKLISFALAMAISLSVGVSSARAADSDASSPQAASTASTLSPQQRGDAIRQFVNQWGPYVENVYGVDVSTWSQRLVQTFATGDATNIQRALQRDTFEGATAELNGVGHKLSDDQAITELAKLSGTQPVINALGDLTADLVFTPVTPCRIADTRNTAAGPVLAGSSRNLGAYGWYSYASFGGSATNCGISLALPDAVMLSITAVYPTAAGYATAYAGDLATIPTVATVNYAAGSIVNNLAVVRVAQTTLPDFKIYSYATSHFVVDIVGYFATPKATALDCVTVDGIEMTIAPGQTRDVLGGTCPVTYTAVGGVCQTNSNTDSSIMDEEISNTRYDCQIFNPTGSGPNQTAIAGTRCCRVPGR